MRTDTGRAVTAVVFELQRLEILLAKRLEMARIEQETLQARRDKGEPCPNS
jgi:hypothetical protein